MSGYTSPPPSTRRAARPSSRVGMARSGKSDSTGSSVAFGLPRGPDSTGLCIADHHPPLFSSPQPATSCSFQDSRALPSHMLVVYTADSRGGLDRDSGMLLTHEPPPILALSVSVSSLIV